MSRAGYNEDIDQWALIRWRGQVASAIRGKRGQAFLLELVSALDAMPDKALIEGELQDGPNVCAIGSVGARRGIDMSKLDPHDSETLSGVFGIADQLVREIEFMNDEASWGETTKQRWRRMRAWAVSQLTPQNAASVIAARSDETPQAVQPEGQVSGAQSADAQPQPSPPSD